MNKGIFKKLQDYLLFDGSEVYYFLIAVLCLVLFMLVPFGIFIELTNTCYWFILPVISCLCACIAFFQLKWISGDMASSVTMIVLIALVKAFYMHVTGRVLFMLFCLIDSFIIFFSILILVYMIYRKKESLFSKQTLIWSLCCIYCIIILNWHSIKGLFIITASFLFITSWIGTNNRSFIGKLSFSIGIMLFFILSSFIITPVNFFLFSYHNIVARYTGRYDSTLIIDKGGKFTIVNGISGLQEFGFSFDTCAVISPYPHKMLGFRDDNNTELLENFKSIIYPIIVDRNGVYFTDGITGLHFIKREDNSDCDIRRLTSKLYFDYIN